MIQFFVTWTVGVIQMWLFHFIADTYIEKRNFPKWIRAGGLLIFSLAGALINQLHIPVLNAAFGITQYIIYTLVFFHTIWYNAILLSAVAWGILAVAETTMGLLWSVMLDSQLTADYFAQDSVMIVIQCLVAILEIVIILIFRSIIQKSKSEKRLPQNLAVIFFPIASCLIAYYILATVVDVFPRQTMVYMGIFLGVFMVVINIASLFGNENVRRRYILQNELDAMQHQEELTVGLLRQQEVHLKEVRAQAHDFKNHLLCLRAMLGDKEAMQNETLQYIDELLKTVDDTEWYTEVINDALRAILTNTAATCKTQGIEFRCRVDYSDFAFMTFSDLSILFSNALNNAIEACAECDWDSGTINLVILRKGEMLFIQLANSNSKEIKTNNGVMMSTKEQPEHHGIGFKNMERVVRKYNGNLTTDYDESEFRLYINLPIINT